MRVRFGFGFGCAALVASPAPSDGQYWLPELEAQINAAANGCGRSPDLHTPAPPPPPPPLILWAGTLPPPPPLMLMYQRQRRPFTVPLAGRRRVEVSDLRVATKEHTNLMKECENSKSKSYRCAAMPPGADIASKQQPRQANPCSPCLRPPRPVVPSKSR